MNFIQVFDKKFIPFIPEEKLQQRVTEIAQQLNKDLYQQRPLFIAILNGAFMFAADIFKQLTIEAEISFIKLASYKGEKSSGNIITSIGLDADLHNRTIVILEDIVDTGKTLHKFIPQILQQHPKQLLVAALLVKPGALQYDFKIDYTGFAVPDKFLLGYGLDYDGFGRNHKEIYQMAEG